MKSTHIAKIILFLIVLFAFAVRFYHITQNPPALNWDEVSIGYNAYSILKTGRDEWGQFLPLHFKSYGEYKLPVQIYSSIPGIALFGLTPMGVRITPVLYGTATVLLLYFLAYELTKNKKMALVSSFLLAVSPWHVHLTRASFESSFSVFWVMLGIWLLYKGFSKPKYILWSTIPFVLAVYTYNSSRVFVPIYLFAILLIYRKKFWAYKKYSLTAALLFALFLVPLVPFTLSGEVANRYKLVSIADDPGLIPRIDEARNLSELPAGLVPLVHNRVTYLSLYFVENYLSHFTPDFLFLSGAPHHQHHVQGVGQMYLIQAPFVILGLYYLLRRKTKLRWLILAWLLIAFIPVAVTRDSIPHALRTIIAAPVYEIICAYGFVESARRAQTRNLKLFLVLVPMAVLVIDFGKYQNNYHVNYAYLYSEDWQYGYKQVVDYIGEHYSEYDKIVFTRHYGEPHMFTLFYLGWDPGEFQTDPNLNRFETFDWVRVLSFDNFYFPDLGDSGTMYRDIVDEFPDQKILFIGKPGDFSVSSKVLSKVSFLNGKEAFYIVENE